MARLTSEELNKVKEKYNVSTLYSWSRVNCFMTSPYEYFLKYVLHKKEDVDNCAYAPLGGIAHSIIERYYGNEIKYEDMIQEFDDGWITAIDVADLKFDRNDEIKNDSIKNKYKENLEHFFRNHTVIDSKVMLEKFIATKIGSFVLQGYIDAIYKDADGYYHIIDWKTSTKYSGKTAEEKCGQLVVYAIGLSQMGVPMDKIRICWNFLKYVSIQYQQKNGAVKTREVERYKIGESLQSNAKVWLKEFGYADQMDEYLKLLLDTNNIEVLPKEVQEKYVISDCYVYVDLTEKLINKWQDSIINAIKDICLRVKDYEQTGSEKAFWDTDESVKSQSYYFATLCGYSANIHKPYKEYLEKLDAQKNGMDLFGGIGDSAESDMFASESAANSEVLTKDSVDAIDLSWLESI